MTTAPRISNIITEASHFTIPPIILLNSTGCSPSFIKSITQQQLPGYTCTGCYDHTLHRSGGTAILLPPHIGCRAQPSEHFGGLATFQTISTTPLTLLVAIYWPPAASITHTAQKKQYLLNFLRQKLTHALVNHHNVVLGGDLNTWHTHLDTSNNRPSQSTAQDSIQTLLHNMSLQDTFRILHPDCRSYTFPTDATQNNSFVPLDYIFVSSSLLPCIATASILPSPGNLSDHHPTFISIQCPTLADKSSLRLQHVAQNKATRTLIDYKGTSTQQWERYAAEIQDRLCSTSTSPDDLWSHFSETINAAARHHLPWRKSSCTTKVKKSLTPRLDLLIKKYRKSQLIQLPTIPLHTATTILSTLPSNLKSLYFSASNTPSSCTVAAHFKHTSPTHITHKDATNFLRFLYNHRTNVWYKIRHKKSLLQNEIYDHTFMLRPAASIINALARYKPHHTLAFARNPVNPTHIHHLPSEVLTALTGQAAKLFPAFTTQITFPDLPQQWQQYYTPLPCLENAWEHLLTPPTPTEIRQALHCSSLDKAPGPSAITARLLSQGGQQSINFLSQIFASCLANNALPTCWLDSSICFIPKGTNPYTGHLTSMRPITLLEVALKLLMRILFGRITNTLMTHNAIKEMDTSVLPGTSTQPALLSLAVTLTWAKMAKHPLYIFMEDKSKAYDSVRDRKSVV